MKRSEGRWEADSETSESFLSDRLDLILRAEFQGGTDNCKRGRPGCIIESM